VERATRRAPLTPGLPTRALAGLALALAIAVGARRARSLAPSGTVAATVVGTIAIAAGWGWGALLILFFATSSALSRWRRAEKERRTATIVEKTGERDAWQVLANGGVFTGAALAAIALPGSTVAPIVAAAGAGALAAAAADTWATEVGVLAGRSPRTIVGGRVVPPGTSGAVSWPGLAAMVAGAVAIAAAARALGVAALLPVLGGGLAGAMVDTMLGSAVQERRWCDRCDVATERRTHVCGAATRHVGGVAGLDNDWVNIACTGAGAAVASLIAVAR